MSVFLLVMGWLGLLYSMIAAVEVASLCTIAIRDNRNKSLPVLDDVLWCIGAGVVWPRTLWRGWKLEREARQNGEQEQDGGGDPGSDYYQCGCRREGAHACPDRRT